MNGSWYKYWILKNVSHNVHNKLKYFHRYEHIDFIKFYTNGRVNKFNYYMNYSVNEKVNKENIRINLDPKFSGYRGVFYENDSSFYIDFSEPITELRNYGILN